MAKGSHGGKGSKPRPIQDKEAFDRNWDRIFGSRTENDTGHQSGLSRFVHAPEADRERIGQEVAERSIERQRELIHASPESGLVERMDDASR